MAIPIRRRGLPDRVPIDMTPMIDIVFQLIVFLMVANDMSRKEIEDLDLPGAEHARQDDGTEKRRIIVNLLRDGGTGAPALRVKGREMDLARFRQFLKPEADGARDAKGASDLTVLVRADRSSRWQDVQWVIQACAERDIRVHRLQFATQDEREGR